MQDIHLSFWTNTSNGNYKFNCEWHLSKKDALEQVYAGLDAFYYFNRDNEKEFFIETNANNYSNREALDKAFDEFYSKHFNDEDEGYTDSSGAILDDVTFNEFNKVTSWSYDTKTSFYEKLSLPDKYVSYLQQNDIDLSKLFRGETDYYKVLTEYIDKEIAEKKSSDEEFDEWCKQIHDLNIH